MNMVRNEVERMFDNVFTNGTGTRAYPSLNMIDGENNIYIEAELPGVTAEELEVTIADGMLTLTGRRTVSTPEGASTLRRERGTLEFERTISLPGNVNFGDTNAVLRDGILMLTLSKSEAAKARRVTVVAEN